MRVASRTTALPILALGLLAGAALAQERDFSKVEIKAQKVAGSVYMLEGMGGNIALSIGDDGIVMVDDQFLPLAAKIQAAIKALSDKPLRFVLNTHWHFDHTGGNEEFGKSATIVAHDNVRTRMAKGATLLNRKIDPAPRVALPVVTFGQSLTLHLNGEEVRALHYPQGHTDGDAVIYFSGSNVVHMGDSFVTYGLPFVDTSSGGTVRGLADNVEKAMAGLPADVKIIPGHGPLSTQADAKKFTDMLRDCISLVEGGQAPGPDEAG